MNSIRRITFARSSRVRAILAVACFCVVGIAFAGSPALIEIVDAKAPSAHTVLGDAEQGRWLAFIDPQVLVLSSATHDHQVGPTVHPAIGVRFFADLPERGQVELVIDGVIEVVKGVTTMTGSLGDGAGGDFVLSLEGDKLLGTIDDGEYIWLVEPQENGGHLLRKVHRGLIPRAPDDEVGHGLGTASDVMTPMSTPTPMAGTNGGVDVLFLYASDVTNPSLRASDIVGRFTQVRNNSLMSTNNSITSVGIYPVASAFAGLSRSAVLTKMRFRTSPFTELDN